MTTIQQSTHTQQQLLQQRALSLAQVLSETQQRSEELLPVIEFRLEKEIYLISMDVVHEVVCIKEYTAFPGIHHALQGMVNVRGKIYSLLDLKQILGLAKKEPASMLVLVLNHPHLQLGFIIDQLIGIKAIAKNSVLEVVDKNPTNKFEYIQGITHEGEALIQATKIFKDFG